MLEQQVLEQVLEHLRPETAETAAKVRLLRCRPRAGTGAMDCVHFEDIFTQAKQFCEAKFSCLIFRGENSGEYAEERQEGEAGRGEKKESDYRSPVHV